MSFSLYGLFVGLGLVVFWSVFERVLYKETPPEGTLSLQRHLWWGLVLVALAGLVGARLYHLATDWKLYQDLPWWQLPAVWQGGLGIFGAIWGGAIGFWIWYRRFRPPVTWSQILGAVGLSLPLGQAIGRWGNWANQELFGPPTSLPWGVPIEQLRRPAEYAAFTHFHPLFLYESLALLGIFFFLWLCFSRYRSFFPLGSGWYWGWYAFAYGNVRFALEFLRLESAPSGLGLSIAQWLSLGLIGIGLLRLGRFFRLQ